MLTDRIIGALTFRKGIYAEVKNDVKFTWTAILIVVVVSFLNRLGSYVNIITHPEVSYSGWLIASLIGAVILIIGFFVVVFIIWGLGIFILKADNSFSQIVRILGLGYVWAVVGLLGLFALPEPLNDILDLIAAAALVLVLIAWLFGMKDAFNSGWLLTAIVVLVAWLVFIGIIYCSWAWLLSRNIDYYTIMFPCIFDRSLLLGSNKWG